MYKNTIIRAFIISAVAMSAAAIASGQDAARLRFDKLSTLESKARDVVEKALNHFSAAQDD